MPCFTSAVRGLRSHSRLVSGTKGITNNIYYYDNRQSFFDCEVAGYNGVIPFATHLFINYLFRQNIYRVDKADGSNIEEDLTITKLTEEPGISRQTVRLNLAHSLVNPPKSRLTSSHISKWIESDWHIVQRVTDCATFAIWAAWMLKEGRGGVFIGLEICQVLKRPA